MSYTTVKLPTEFVESNIVPILKKKELGFSSNADVIKAAVRDFADKIFPKPIPEAAH